MKKLFSGIFIVLLFLIPISPANAAQDIHIKLDDAIIKSDLAPEIKNNRIMVPVRVISENLGAKVDWTKSEVTLAKDDLKVILKLNSKTAFKNGKAITIDAKPYVKNNRILVPLRFLAEIFGCNVHYENFNLTINTKPLVINGETVKALQQESWMTMGSIVQQIQVNAYNKDIYNVISKNMGDRVEAPNNYSSQLNLDVPGSYYKQGRYDFLNFKDESIKRFEIYILVESFPPEILAGYSEALIHVADADEWYLFNSNAINSISQLIEAASKNGFLILISNTVV